MGSRVEKAVELFMSGYNCSQSVFAAYSDLFGMDREQALKVSCSMGGGMGRMREVVRHGIGHGYGCGHGLRQYGSLRSSGQDEKLRDGQEDGGRL